MVCLAEAADCRGDAWLPGPEIQSGNSNEVILHILESSKSGASPSDSFVIIRTLLAGVLLLCKDGVGVFYSLSRLSYFQIE